MAGKKETANKRTRKTKPNALNPFIDMVDDKQKRKKKDVITSGVSTNLDPGYKRSAIVVNIKQWDRLRDYAYTERITIREALEIALEEFLKDKTEILKAPKK